MKPLEIIVVCGPTGAGKTEKALEVAEKINGEIVSVDSLQIFREMDVGTAKPDLAVRGRIPHHMIDVVNPDEPYDASRYARGAMEAVQSIVRHGKIPVLAGGAGLYYKALLEGFFEGPKADSRIREKWESAAREKGREFVHGHLKKVDPESALTIHPNNLHRVVRAIEIFELTGKKKSAIKGGGAESRFAIKEMFFLNPSRAELFQRIALRTRWMFEGGLLEEVERLLKKYPSVPPPLKSIGYKQAAQHLAGKLSLRNAEELTRIATQQYARRQLTWFRHQGIGGKKVF